MSLSQSLNKVAYSLKQRGLAATASRSFLAATWKGDGKFAPIHPFDLEHGTDTSGTLWNEDVWAGTSGDEHNVGYAGIATSRLRMSLRRWKETLGSVPVEEFSFIDLGCGKGRSLLLASELPFRQGTGVEINPGLLQTAERNLTIWNASGKARCPLHLILGDAREITLPEGPVLVFVYNSFGPEIMRDVLGAIGRQRSTRSDRVDLLYQTETPEAPLRTDPRLRLVWSERLPLSWTDATYDPVAGKGDITSLYRWSA